MIPNTAGDGAVSHDLPTTAAHLSDGSAQGRAPSELRPQVDRLTTGKLIDHGPARHEFHSNGHPSYFVKLLTADGPRTVWGKGLERAFQRSRTQPQINDFIGIRENNATPVSVVTRTRNAEGLVTATRQLDTPRPQWVVEKLEEFDLRAAAAQALRDPTLSRREAITHHRELAGAYWILDTAQKHAADTWPHHPQTQQRFLSELRETLALTVERGIELPAPKPAPSDPTVGRPESDRTRSR